MVFQQMVCVYEAAAYPEVQPVMKQLWKRIEASIKVPLTVDNVKYVYETFPASQIVQLAAALEAVLTATERSVIVATDAAQRARIAEAHVGKAASEANPSIDKLANEAVKGGREGSIYKDKLDKEIIREVESLPMKNPDAVT
ncbi:MAG: hypothetical protein M1830_008272 [Pleopsidium flavum]|nr:MAG: hypothetical protein M1830_008272 [Pleopsidium flavum]